MDNRTPSPAHTAEYPKIDAESKSEFINSNKAVIETLTNFLTSQIDRMNNNDNKKKFIKGLGEKCDLYQRQLTLLKDLENSKEDKQSTFTSLTKAVALVSHHKRYSKRDQAVHIASFGIFRGEATSWKAWKKLSIDKDNPYSSVFKATLKNKAGRTIHSDQNSKIDNYNEYRESILRPTNKAK